MGPPVVTGTSDMAEGFINQRSQERKKVHWRAFILLPDGSKLPAQVVNISSEGLSLLSPRSFPANVQLELAIGVPLPKDASKLSIASVTATVRYSVLSGEHFQIGLRIEKMSEADRQRIYDATHKHP